MKAAVWHGRLDVRVDDVRDPGVPAPGNVLVEVVLSAICGSDLAEYVSGPHVISVERPHPLTGRTAPVTLGHEYVGVVAATGEGVEGLEAGNRVCGDSCLRCNRCFWCLRGEYNICAVSGSVGFHADGAFARFLEVPAYVLERVPAGVEDAAAAIVEPLAVGRHAVRQGRLEVGDAVVVVGYGMVGAAVSVLAAAAGASAVYVVEPQPRRRELALELGATEAIDPAGSTLRREIRSRTNGVGADVVFDCSGHAATLGATIELARRGGRVVLTGIPHGPSQLEASRIVYFERELVGALGYRFDHARVLALLASRALDVTPLAAPAIPLSELVAGGLERMRSDPAAPIRIFVAPGG
jgi:(R,R)-butanediol dehydrogenase/meso-butanediol dehydrogenase/diacetyl reductase